MHARPSDTAAACVAPGPTRHPPCAPSAPPAPASQLSALPGTVGGSSRAWFPRLRELQLLGYVAASDADLMCLSSLTALTSLHLHLQKPSRGLAGRVTLRGLWGVAERCASLAQVQLSGAMETLLMVPGRLPGVGL